MNSIELIVTTLSIIVALCIGITSYILLMPPKGQIKPKEQVTKEASLVSYDETAKLKARIDFLENQIVEFSDICLELTNANKKYLDYFEEYIKLSENK